MTLKKKRAKDTNTTAMRKKIKLSKRKKSMTMRVPEKSVSMMGTCSRRSQKSTALQIV